MHLMLMALLSPWAGAQSLDLVGLQAAEDGDVGPEYRRLAEVMRLVSLARLQTLMDKGVADETRAELELRLADLSFEQGRLAGDEALVQRAATLYSHILQDFPRYARADQATFYLGRVELLRGDERAALDAFKNVVKLWPDSQFVPDAYLWIGELMVDDDPFASLKAWIQVTAATDHPRAAYAAYRLAWAYHDLDEHEKAAQMMVMAAASQDDRVRQAAETDLATWPGAGAGVQPAPVPPSPTLDLSSIAIPESPTWTIETSSPAPVVGPCAQLHERHQANAGESQGPQLQLQVVQCWTAQREPERASAELADLEARYGPGSEWYRARTKAERRRTKETIRRGEVLVDTR